MFPASTLAEAKTDDRHPRLLISARRNSLRWKTFCRCLLPALLHRYIDPQTGGKQAIIYRAAIIQ